MILVACDRCCHVIRNLDSMQFRCKLGRSTKCHERIRVLCRHCKVKGVVFHQTGKVRTTELIFATTEQICLSHLFLQNLTCLLILVGDVHRNTQNLLCIFSTPSAHQIIPNGINVWHGLADQHSRLGHPHKLQFVQSRDAIQNRITTESLMTTLHCLVPNTHGHVNNGNQISKQLEEGHACPVVKMEIEPITERGKDTHHNIDICKDRIAIPQHN
mmetsp:Transcript_10420/g.24163  ORF Transcript_10420/g.24163 Transcript_10420/m.24163 type:complete len:215 (+) Transcript_10420:1719-2363(+)